MPMRLFDGMPVRRRLSGARVALALCTLLRLGTNVSAKATNYSSTLCRPSTGLSSIICGQSQPLQILAAATYSACYNDSTFCGPTADAPMTSYLYQLCSNGASSCTPDFDQIKMKLSNSCYIDSIKINYSCGGVLVNNAPLAGTTAAPDNWWMNYESWQFIVIWCIIGCVIIIIVITILLLLCGCCPNRCHRYDEPNNLGKTAFMTLTSLESHSTIDYRSGSSSSFSLTRSSAALQSDYCSAASSSGGGGGGGGSPDGDQASSFGGAHGAAGGEGGGGWGGGYATLEFGPTRGGRVTSSHGAGDRMSTLSRGHGSMPNLDYQNSSQDSGIGGYDEPDASGVEFGTKRRRKQDPQPAYFGQKGLACPADVSAQTATLRRSACELSAGDGSRPRGLFQKNTAAAGSKDGLRGGDLMPSPSDLKTFDPPPGVYATATRRGSSFSALTDTDVAAAQRSSTLGRLQSRSKSAIALIGADDSLHALRTSTLTREKTKTRESNRTVTMSLEEALAAGCIEGAATPVWSGVISAATLPRKRPTEVEAAAAGDDADGK